MIRSLSVFIYLFAAVFLAKTAYAVEHQTVDCFNNADCLSGYYCAKSPGDCDGPGICVLRPDFCIQIISPVCGCDGETYINANCATVLGVNVAYEGECHPAHCIDLDFDGYAINGGDCGPVDCDDSDPSVNPSASEKKHDGIDQDCNGYDLTIDIIKVNYNCRNDSLEVEATSSFGDAANLNLEGYGSMKPERGKDCQIKWVITVKPAGGDPGVVTVCGFEGCESANTGTRHNKGQK